MADQGFVGFDESSALPVMPPAPRANPTDADWSHVPEARTNSKGPDGELPAGPSWFSRFVTSKTGPQDLAPAAGGAPAVAEPSVGTGQPATPGPTTPIQPAEPPAPAEKPAATSYPSWPTPPAPPEEPWLTRTAKSVADAISGIHATSHAIWERDTILTGLSAAQSDAIADINDKVKATYGVELPDPTHGGYLDQAAKNIRDRVYQGGLSAVGANEPESVFGGGDRYRAAVQKEQFKLWDDARTALAAQHGASEATRDEAASVLQTDTPAAQLGAKYSHAANVAESQAWERGDFSTRAFMTAAGIGVSALNPRDPMTIPSLMVGGGMEPTMAKAFYPLARPALKVASDIAEQGVRQALVNMGLTTIEAPEHQAANAARGEEHGLQPALKDIGTSALYGFIPGALIGGVKALSRAWGSEAARTPVDEFIRQAYGQAPDEELTDLIKAHFDAIHAWEEANGYEKGSSYSDAGLRDRGARERWGQPPEPPPAPGAPPEPPPASPRTETPRAAAAATETPPGAPRELAPPLWEGKPYPTPPDVPDSARQRPSPSSITLAAIESAEADHAALPPSIPGVPPSEIMRAYKEAIQHAESPDVMAPPEPPMTAPPRPDEGFLKPDHVHAPPARPTAGGAVVATSGYDGPDPDAVKNRIAHLQAVASAPDTAPRVAREMAGRVRDFTRFVDERDARMTAAGVSEDQARAIRALRPGDIVTAENTHGDHVTGKIEGWGRHGLPTISDNEGIDHSILPETITNIRSGVRENVQAHGGAAQGTVVMRKGKPYTEGVRFDPRQLKTDALTYQYKGNADESGVTPRLRTVRIWDGMSAGNIVVHEHLDGTQYVADGHQRTGLANRIMDADPTQKITLQGMLFKESDGWTVKAARTEAALKNIREGLGDTIDMARVLRDAPESWDDSLPIGRPDLKEAKGLANLSDAAWEMALNNVVPHNYASLVGNMVPDKTMHVAIMDDLARVEPRSQNQARFVITDAMNAGIRAANEGKQLILEGFGPTERTLLAERSQVYDEASRLLRSDAKLFSMLDAQAGRIEEAGNVLVDTNADQATRAGQLAQALGKLAERAGPTSAALNRAAQTVADGVKPKTAARAFLTELPALLQQEGLKVPSAPTPPAYDVDTPQGRAEQTQDLEAEFMASQPGMFGPPVKTLEEQRQAIKTDIKQKMLDADMPEAEAEANAAIVAARMATRAARMGRADPEQFYREQGWVVRGDRQREAEVAGVAREGGRAFEQAPETDAFKKWFGDSKVVDADGKPQAVYHGTTADFSEFDKSILGRSTRHPTAQLGFFFSASPDIASRFTDAIDDSTWPVRIVQRPGANVMPVYLSIKNPFEMTAEQFRQIQAVPYGEDVEREQPEASARMFNYIAKNKELLLKQGYDGIHVKGDPKYADTFSGEEYAHDAWAAFEPTQIKSAIGNRGTFDPTSPKILDQPATVPTFYSAVERAVEGAKQAKASPEQWLAMIKNMPGVKAEELKFLGIEDWLKGQKGPITRAEVADYVRANSIEVREVEKNRARAVEIDRRLSALNDQWSRQHQRVNMLRREVDIAVESGADVTGPQARVDDAQRILAGMTDIIRRAEAIPSNQPKFSQYVLPGGEPGTYRELLLTLPEKDRIIKTPVKVPAGWGDTEGGDIGVETTGNTGADFRHSHWDEPNVLAHVRFDDRTIDGKRALHIGEFQSDWAKAARKKGIRPSQAEIDAMPRARSWMDFMAEKGFTPEEAMQKWRMRAAREDVALHDEHLLESEGREMAWARAMGGVPPAPYIGSTDSWATLSLKRMVRYAAENGYDMLSWDTGATNAARYPDEDRQKGAKGFEDLYDKQIPQIVSKLTKKFGGKVEEARVPAGAPAVQRAAVAPDAQARAEHGVEYERLDDEVARLAGLEEPASDEHTERAQHARAVLWTRMVDETIARMKAGPPVPVHSLIITPALKEAALNEGFPLFQASTAEPRGRVTIRDNSKVIDLFSKRNASTMMHEAHHIFLEEMAQDAADPNAPQQIKDDFQTILDELGAKDAESITEEQHEQWARWGEQYLRDGRAPSAALARAFAAFKEWLKAIYRTLRGLGKEIPDSIREVMDRMIATDEEIAAHRGATPAEPLVPLKSTFTYKGKIYQGNEHSDAMAQAAKAHGIDFSDLDETDIDLGNFGYVNKQGQNIPDTGGPSFATRKFQAAADTRAPGLVTGDPLVDHVTADPYVASAIADPVINRKNDVPYGAGPNKANDRVVNVDRHVPKTDTIGGVKYEPARAVAVHEQVEKHALDQLMAAGVPETEAYQIAHFVFAEPAERAWVEANIGPKAWDKYQAKWDKWLKPIEHENPKNPPPDLYQKPYPHDDAHLAPTERGSDKAFEEAGHANLPALRATAERVLGGRALEGAVAEGRMGDLETTVRGVAHEAAVAAAASPDPLDRQIGQILEREVAPLIDEAFPPATEAGPEGTQQTLMPGVEPVTGADRARVGAAAPLRGGNAPPPEGGLFDDLARAQRDLYDLIPTEDGLISSHDLATKVPLETMLAKLVGDCGRA